MKKIWKIDNRKMVTDDDEPRAVERAKMHSRHVSSLPPPSSSSAAVRGRFFFVSVFHCEFESNVVRCSRSDSSSSCADGSHFVTCHWKKKIWIFLSSCQVHRYKMDVRRLEHSTKDHVRWKAAKSVWNFVGAHVTISCWARFNCHVTWFLANRFWAVKSRSRDLISTNRQSIVGSRPWAGCICGNGPVDGRHIE